MSQVAVTVEGLAEFRRALRRTAPEVDRELRRRLRALAGEVAADAAARAPRRTGALAGSIRPVVQARLVGVRSKDPAARAWHFGLRHPLFGNRERWYPMPKRPFIFDAAEARRDEMVRRALDAMVDAARAVGWGAT